MYGVPEYWIVDPWKRQIDPYRLAECAEVPTTLTAVTLTWQPVPEGPILTIDLAELFDDLD
jgi:Uma2 family endonuclease